MKCLKLSSIIILALVFCFSQKSISQNSLNISFEFQAYPTGLIPGVSVDASVGPKSIIYGRVGYNWIRHRDLGKHEDERGDGWGFSLAYKRAFKNSNEGWRLGVKTDLWWNSIDWKEGNQTGSTDITVIQPTIELSHVFQYANLVFTPSLALGYEVNIKTVGENTGEGAIVLIGFQIGKRLR